jgi:hypothetical protein
VAVAQYTFTHKQYTEYKERNIHIIDTAWEIHHDPRVPEELKQYLNSALVEDRQYFSASLGSLLPFLQR